MTRKVVVQAAAEGNRFRWHLAAGERGVQFAELALWSSAEGRRLEVPLSGVRT